MGFNQYGYKKVRGKCKSCPGCMRLEDINFMGTDECIYAPDWKEECKKILKGDSNVR